MTDDTGVYDWPVVPEMPGSGVLGVGVPGGEVPGIGVNGTGVASVGEAGSWPDGLTEGAALVADQEFDADSLYQLRACIAAHAADSGLSRQRRDDLVMAVHELAANAVRHGPGHGRIRVWRGGPTIVCEVSDEGQAQLSDQPGCSSAASDSDFANGGVHVGSSYVPSSGDLPAGSDFPGGSDFPWPVKPGHGLWLVSQISDYSIVRRDSHGVRAVVSFFARPPGSAGQTGPAQSAGNW